MPPIQRGQAYQLGPKRWGLRYYDRDGRRRRKSPFPSRSAALTHYRDIIEAKLRGETPKTPDMTLSAFVTLYLDRHAAQTRPKTIANLRWRLGKAEEAFGDINLRELERMSADVADWIATLSEGSRYGITAALRQALGAAVRWGYMAENPAKLAGANPQPAPRTVRPFTPAELDAIAAELSPRYRPLIAFAAATGLRPEEWQALERRDVDRHGRVLSVCRTLSSGEVVELGKTTGSRRQVPLSQTALAALEAIPARLDTPLLFPAPRGGVLNLDNFRRREWRDAVTAAGVSKPARIYDLRSTFASRALAAGVSVFQLARIMGTSVKMIERHYGAMLDGSGAAIASRLDQLDALDREARSEGGS